MPLTGLERLFLEKYLCLVYNRTFLFEVSGSTLYAAQITRRMLDCDAVSRFTATAVRPCGCEQ